MSALLQSWGIAPDYIVGHSTGEVAASYVSGILCLEDAIRVIFHRSRLQQRMAGTGRMAAVGLPESDAKAKIAHWADRVSIAAVNGPSSVTLSGDAAALKEIQDVLEAEQVFFRFLQVDIPFHSSKMDPLCGDLLAALQTIKPRQSEVPIFSTVTGNIADRGDFDAVYWWRNVRESVLFGKAVHDLLDRGVTVFLEIGPHPVLSTSIFSAPRQPVKTIRSRWLPCGVMRAIGRTCCVRSRGFGPKARNRVGPICSLTKPPSLPSRVTRGSGNAIGTSPRRVRLIVLHQRRTHCWVPGCRAPLPHWENKLAATHPKFLGDHRVRGNVVFPATGYIEMGLAAALTLYSEDLPLLENVRFEKALFLKDKKWHRIALEVDLQGVFTIHAKQNDDEDHWVLHARGEVKARRMNAPISPPLATLRERCRTTVSTAEFYGHLADIGLDYGGSFRGIAGIQISAGCAIGELELSTDVLQQRTSYLLHPAALDACLQALIATFPGFERGALKNLYLPVEVSEISVFQPFALPATVFAVLSHTTSNLMLGDLTLFAANGGVIASMRSIACRPVGDLESALQSRLRDRLCEYRWVARPREQIAECNLTSPTAITPKLQARTAIILNASERAVYYEKVEPRLAALSVQYIYEALLQLGFGCARNEPTNPRILTERYGVQPRFGRLCARLIQILKVREILVNGKDEGSQADGPCSARRTHDAISQLQWEHPSFALEIDLLRRCGENLAEVLTGKINPVELLFPEGELNRIAEFYSSSPSFGVYNELVAYGLQQLLNETTRTAPLRIIEVGAGTGGLTSSGPAGDRLYRRRVYVHRHCSAVLDVCSEPV